jgi:dTDP-D-glucose 4,6-dehydratase
MVRAISGNNPQSHRNKIIKILVTGTAGFIGYYFVINNPIKVCIAVMRVIQLICDYLEIAILKSVPNQEFCSFNVIG